MKFIKQWQQSAKKLTPFKVGEDDIVEQTLYKATEEQDFHKEFFRAFTKAEEKINNLDDPKEIGMVALKAACDFYDADWCGVLDVDLKMEFLMPFWWYNRITGGMTSTIIDETGISGILPRWMEALKNNVPIVVEDVEAIKADKPKEYALFKKLDTDSMLAVPFRKREKGFLILKNPKRYIEQIDFLKALSFVLVSEINEQKLMNQIAMSGSPDNIRSEKDVTIHLFGGLEIFTSKGKLTEDEMKSPMCCKLVVLLLLNRHRGMTARELTEKLWREKESENGTSRLRVLLYRFRQLFELISDMELIITTSNGYRINPELNLNTDYEELESVCDTINQIKSCKQQVEALKKAVRLYKGNLFPTGESEHWQMAYNSKYHLLYLDAANQLLDQLYQLKDYKELHEFSTLVSTVEPYSPMTLFWLIIVLRKHGAMEMAKSQLDYARVTLLKEEYLELENRLEMA